MIVIHSIRTGAEFLALEGCHAHGGSIVFRRWGYECWAFCMYALSLPRALQSMVFQQPAFHSFYLRALIRSGLPRHASTLFYVVIYLHFFQNSLREILAPISKPDKGIKKEKRKDLLLIVMIEDVHHFDRFNFPYTGI